MPLITFVTHDGQKYETEAINGHSVMETAIRAGIPGIDAECGGACSCATCQVYVDEAFSELVGPPHPMEQDMLDFAWEPKETSRLSCQIEVTDALDGIILHVPERQS